MLKRHFLKYYLHLGVLIYVHTVIRMSLEGVMAHIAVVCISEMSDRIMKS